MEVIFNSKYHSLDIHCDEPTYALINTSEYMSHVWGKTEKDSSVIIVKHSELGVYGFGQEIDIEIGERLISENDGNGTQLIRLS